LERWTAARASVAALVGDEVDEGVGILRQRGCSGSVDAVVAERSPAVPFSRTRLACTFSAASGKKRGGGSGKKRSHHPEQAVAARGGAAISLQPLGRRGAAAPRRRGAAAQAPS
jgi:hypothetical protein